MPIRPHGQAVHDLVTLRARTLDTGEDGGCNGEGGVVINIISMQNKVLSAPTVETSGSTDKNKNMFFCSAPYLKLYSGVVVLTLVTSAWVTATLAMKATYHLPSHKNRESESEEIQFSAPFLTCWFCTVWTILFFPLHLLSMKISSCWNKNSSNERMLENALSKFRVTGIKPKVLLFRSFFFCLLSVTTNYLYVASLRHLDCSVVTALFATNTSFVYILSWVILHEQFVGIRIMAVILSTTGISLLAYMDGVVKSNDTLRGVLIASAAAACSAVYKVSFKKVMGSVTFDQASLFFTIIGIINSVFLWPVVLFLYFTGIEIFEFTNLPWTQLCGSAFFSLVANLLANFSILITYENFITFGLVLAIPVSAGYDAIQNGVTFNSMKQAGIIIICCGFIIVLTPSNWDESVMSIIRWSRRPYNLPSHGTESIPDLRTGYIGSRLRSPSGRVK